MRAYRELMIVSLVAACAVFYLSSLSGYAYGQASGESAASARMPPAGAADAGERWIVSEGKFVVLYYKPSADLGKIERRLRGRIFSIKRECASGGAGEAYKVLCRVDLLLDKVKEMLDMHPSRPPIRVKIFPNTNELDERYYSIFKKNASYKAFYVHAYNTIYTSEDSISDSVISHELGHAVIDSYFGVIPPERVRELVATFIDSHLDD